MACQPRHDGRSVARMDERTRTESREWAHRLVESWPLPSDAELARLRRILRAPAPPKHRAGGKHRAGKHAAE